MKLRDSIRPGGGSDVQIDLAWRARPRTRPGMYGGYHRLLLAARVRRETAQPRRRVWELGTSKLPATQLVIDGTRHELREGVHRVPLSSRFVLRRLLYAFASKAGHRLTREAIARALWSTDYDPRRHESSLKSNIRRLRQLLAGTNAAIETSEDGYRLFLPAGALFVPPDE